MPILPRNLEGDLMAVDDKAAGPTTEDNVGDVLWLLLAVLVILGMVKVFALTPQPPEPPRVRKVDLSPQEQAVAAVAALKTSSEGLPAGGTTVHIGDLADGLTAGSARHLVIVLDGRAVMAPYWERAVELVQVQLLGCPSAERVEVIVLGAPAEGLPPPLSRPTPTDRIAPLSVANWCGELKRIIPAASNISPPVELETQLLSATIDANTRVVVLLRDQASLSKPILSQIPVPAQFVLFGAPDADSLGAWALRSARASGGTVSFLP
jgi:hypothetical protein